MAFDFPFDEQNTSDNSDVFGSKISNLKNDVRKQCDINNLEKCNQNELNELSDKIEQEQMMRKGNLYPIYIKAEEGLQVIDWENYKDINDNKLEEQYSHEEASEETETETINIPFNSLDSLSSRLSELKDIEIPPFEEFIEEIKQDPRAVLIEKNGELYLSPQSDIHMELLPHKNPSDFFNLNKHLPYLLSLVSIKDWYQLMKDTKKTMKYKEEDNQHEYDILSKKILKRFESGSFKKFKDEIYRIMDEEESNYNNEDFEYFEDNENIDREAIQWWENLLDEEKAILAYIGFTITEEGIEAPDNAEIQYTKNGVFMPFENDIEIDFSEAIVRKEKLINIGNKIKIYSGIQIGEIFIGVPA